MGIDGVSEGSNFSEAHRTLSALSLHCFSGAVRSQLQLQMTQELANLSGADLTVACACITLTCLEFPGVEAVSIRAVGSKLDGKQRFF